MYTCTGTQVYNRQDQVEIENAYRCDKQQKQRSYKQENTYLPVFQVEQKTEEMIVEQVQHDLTKKIQELAE